MNDLLLELEKNEYYQSLIKDLPEEEQPIFIETMTKMAREFSIMRDNFSEMISSCSEKDLLKLIDEVGEGLNRRSFRGNPGVTEVPWPITKQD